MSILKRIPKKGKSNFNFPKKIAVLYSDDDPKYFKTHEEYLTVAEAYEDALRFGPILKKLKIKTAFIKADSKLVPKLLSEKPDLAINLVTTFKGKDDLGASIPAVLELLEIPFTGTGIVGFTLGSNKFVLHALMNEHGIPVPRFQLLDSLETEINSNLRYPLILKLNEEHSNLEITMDSVVETERELRKRLKYLMDTYKQDVLVSEFIEGREFGVFVVDTMSKSVYAKERIINIPELKPKYQFLDYKLTWLTEGKDYDDRLKHKKYNDPVLTALSKKAFDVCRMNQYGKFDVRMDKKGNYYFIDANANCYFAPPDLKYDSEIARTVEMYGVKFEVMLKNLIEKAMKDQATKK